MLEYVPPFSYWDFFCLSCNMGPFWKDLLISEVIFFFLGIHRSEMKDWVWFFLLQTLCSPAPRFLWVVYCFLQAFDFSIVSSEVCDKVFHKQMVCLTVNIQQIKLSSVLLQWVSLTQKSVRTWRLNTIV